VSVAFFISRKAAKAKGGKHGDLFGFPLAALYCIWFCERSGNAILFMGRFQKSYLLKPIVCPIVSPIKQAKKNF